MSKLDLSFEDFEASLKPYKMDEIRAMAEGELGSALPPCRTRDDLLTAAYSALSGKPPDAQATAPDGDAPAPKAAPAAGGLPASAEKSGAVVCQALTPRGRWRAGVYFPVKPTRFDADKWTPDQRAAIEADPQVRIKLG